MPTSIVVSIGMPTIWYPFDAPIMNIGICASTPATMAIQPSQTAIG